MKKYSVGNVQINFNEELKKMIEMDDVDDDENNCKISGSPLIDNCVTLECNHKFNYDALYKEICKQKYDFKSYNYDKLRKKEQKKVFKSGKDYFIKCPYCRHIQFTLLPYNEELGLEEKYGVNSLNKPFIECCLYGKTFKSGVTCSYVIPGTVLTCTHDLSTELGETGLTYCEFHYNNALKKYKDKLKEEANNKQKMPKPKCNIAENYPLNPDNKGCQAILKYGFRKGQCCGLGTNEFCGMHLSKQKI